MQKTVPKVVPRLRVFETTDGRNVGRLLDPDSPRYVLEGGFVFVPSRRLVAGRITILASANYIVRCRHDVDN